MHVFWEKVGVLGPVYRLVGKGSVIATSQRNLILRNSASRPASYGYCISWG
jgi:hypothetical protein